MSTTNRQRKPIRWCVPWIISLVMLTTLLITLDPPTAIIAGDCPPPTVTPKDIVPIVFAVYAPFGTDDRLSQQADPFISNLAATAVPGFVHIVALVDNKNATRLIEITDGSLQETCLSKRDMGDPQTLIDFMAYVQAAHPSTRVVLSLEGHGGGYIPDVDPSEIKPTKWSTPTSDGDIPLQATPTAKGLEPPLPMGSPELSGQELMSTYDLYEALDHITLSGTNKIDLLVLNNCFNLSVEVLATVAPFAEYAVGYPNYNFFSKGVPYQEVFSGETENTPTLEFAQKFAVTNRAYLHSISTPPNEHPTIGGVVTLTQMYTITAYIDVLARELITAVNQGFSENIALAIETSQKYDTTSCQEDMHPEFELGVPDAFTDLHDFAGKLMETFSGISASGVYTAAQDLYNATRNIQVYSDGGLHPWVHQDLDYFWEFPSQLSLNIFLPIPNHHDFWDWRTLFYVGAPNRHANGLNTIDFVRTNHWREFLVTFYAQDDFAGIMRPCVPPAPLTYQ